METIGKYDVGDVVAYVTYRLESVGSLKKLMKLLFLIQYETRRLFTPRAVKFLYHGAPVTRAEFFIWSFGPMANEVYDALEDESRFRIEPAEEGPAYTVRYLGDPPKLPPPVAKRVDDVLKRYGGYKAWELERKVNQLLGLEPEKKEEYMGYAVDKYLQLEGFRLEIRDLAHGN